MSILAQEILRHLSPVTPGETGEIRVSVAFPPEFSGFKGHFPGRPVLPGVCMVQTALVALGIFSGGIIKLRQVISAKWLAPVLPDEKLDWVLRPKPGEADVTRVKVSVTRSRLTSGSPGSVSDERIAEFTLEITGLNS